MNVTRDHDPREPGVFDAIYAGHDHAGRARFASTVDKATRLARGPSLFAFADDQHAVELFVDYLRRRRASLDLMRRVVAID